MAIRWLDSWPIELVRCPGEATERAAEESFLSFSIDFFQEQEKETGVGFEVAAPEAAGFPTNAEEPLQAKVL